eukprot:2660971-Prymnesium_polylepis.1
MRTDGGGATRRRHAVAKREVTLAGGRTTAKRAAEGALPGRIALGRRVGRGARAGAGWGRGAAWGCHAVAAAVPTARASPLIADLSHPRAARRPLAKRRRATAPAATVSRPQDVLAEPHPAPS